MTSEEKNYIEFLKAQLAIIASKANRSVADYINGQPTDTLTLAAALEEISNLAQETPPTEPLEVS